MTQAQRTPAQMSGQAAAAADPSALLEQMLTSASEKQRFLKTELESRIDQIEEVLPPLMKGQGARLAKRALMTFARAKDGMNTCSAADFIRAVLEAAELGLAIDGKLAYVVPYKGKWQMQPDYKGIVAVARRNKLIKDVYADVVFSNDQFSHGRRNGESYLEHTYDLGKPRGDTCRGAYAVIKLPDGDWRYEVMDMADLERIRMRSPAVAKNSGPWQSDPNEMRKKTVMRRALKMYADDPAMSRALELDERFDEEPATTSNARKVEELLQKPAPAKEANGPPTKKLPYELAQAEAESQEAAFDRTPVSEATVSAIKDEAKRQFGERAWAKDLAALVHQRTERRNIEDITTEQAQEILEFLRGGPEPGIYG